MYLHEDRDTFSSIIEQVSNERGKSLINCRKGLLCNFNFKIAGRTAA